MEGYRVLIGYYEGLHFMDLLSSFRHVAWSCQYSVGTQDDPILDCISHFKSRCYDKGIRLEQPSFWMKKGMDYRQIIKNYGPILFVISGHSKELSLTEILDCVNEGSNLAIIYSPYLYSAYEKNCCKLLSTLNISKETLESYSNERRVICYGKGRIIYIHSDDVNDCNIESGPFGGNPSEDKKNEAKRKFDDIIESISTFAVPYIDCTIRSIPTSWPRDETLVIEVELRNKSLVNIDLVSVEMSFVYDFEPLSNTNFQLENFKAGTTRSATSIVIPRKKGVITNPVRIYISYNNFSGSIYLLQSRINILDNLHSLLRSSKPAQMDLPTMLSKYEHYLEPVVTKQVILQLLEIDPDSVIAKMRRAGELIAKNIARKHIKGFKDFWNFATITRELYEQRIISAKSKGYIDTIRILGNIASHANDLDKIIFNRDDAFVICHALILFLKETVEANLL